MGVILAPHADDELIGCWSLLTSGLIHTVIYFYELDRVRRQEAINCAATYNFLPLFAADFNVQQWVASYKTDTFYLPNFHDSHPDHKQINRDYRTLPSVRYYSVDLDNAANKAVFSPTDQCQKRFALDSLYPSQRELWNVNHSYFLFEAISPTDCLVLNKDVLTLNNKTYTIWSDITLNTVCQKKSVFESGLLVIFDPQILNWGSASVDAVGKRLIDSFVAAGASSVEVHSDQKVWRI